MNILSWTLYFAEVSDSIRWFAWLVTVVSAVMLVVCIICWIASSIEEDKNKTAAEGAPNVEVYRKDAVNAMVMSQTFFRGFAKGALPIFLGFFLIAAFLPSKNTIMLIAASQVGEAVLTSDPAKQIGGEIGGLTTDTLTLLRDYIKEQVGEKAPKRVEEPNQ